MVSPPSGNAISGNVAQFFGRKRKKQKRTFAKLFSA
jgi:hypothetical protein